MPRIVQVQPCVVHLREVEHRDVPVLFEIQLDPESNLMAGTKPRSAEAFQAVWERALGDPKVIPRVIVVDAAVVGSIACFEQDQAPALGYWIAREHWGKGIATHAVQTFLTQVAVRPLRAAVARANTASIRVLEKCGFRCTGYRMGIETERYLACEEATFVLERR